MELEAEKLRDNSGAAIPSTFPFPKRGKSLYSRSGLDQDLREYKERDIWINVGMFAFVSWEWVNPLAEWLKGKRVLEIMAGAGWLARALQEKGIAVIATDDHSWPKARAWKLQTEVEALDALAAIQKYADQTDILLISWPYMDPTAFLSLQAWAKLKPGALVIYIGEGDGGCTADFQFFEHFEDVEDRDFEQASRKYVAWWGMHDYLTLGKYRTPL